MKRSPNFSRLIVLTTAIGVSLFFIQCRQSDPQLGKASVKKVISAMTLEEKVALVVGKGMNMGGVEEDTTSGGTVIGNIEDLVVGAAGTTVPIRKYGITPLVVADGPAGLRISPTRENDPSTYYCTAFPVATLLASTWDVDLIKQVGEAYGNEVHEYGVDILLSPGMNIQWNPLCGRNFEYYSEDPFVSGKIAAAMVNGIESQGVGTSIKHFAANNQETNRRTVDAIVSERALREIYLEGFRIAVEESQPWTVMSSYNILNGTFTSESHDLLTKVLRDDWGFKGFVVSDWFGGVDAVKQMKAGNDLLMPGTPFQVERITEAVQNGTLDESIIDQNAERILNIILESPRFNKYEYSNKPNLEQHAKIARQAGAEGMVLLKNENNTLPISSEVKTIAAFGNTSYDIIIGGSGSGDVNEAYKVSLVEGLKNAGYSVDKGLMDVYSNFIKEERAKIPPPANAVEAMRRGDGTVAEMQVKASLAKQMAEKSDMALITIGRLSGESSDREVEGNFKLTDDEMTMVQEVSKAFHAKGKKAIVVLNIGGIIETASWKSYPDAVLLAWQPGQEAGNAISDILTGKVNPSGKLTATFPASYVDVPSSDIFPGIELPDAEPIDWGENPLANFFSSTMREAIYEDGIYVGYRYYDTYDVEPAYEFGYGLSYTQFDFSNLTLSTKDFDNSISVSVEVTNTGDVAGKEVVQLYLTAPAEKLEKPSKELKGFAKTKLLEPGETQIITIELNERSLASFDTASSSWIAEKGTYEVKVGSSSRNIKLTDTFTLADELVVKKVTKALIPEIDINEWSKK